MNRSKLDIIGNLQCNFKNVKYVDDDMVGVSDIGLVRKKQEDSILLLKHFLNEDFNLMAIADGMGGLANGARASNILLKSIIDWFESLSSKYYTDISEVYNNLISNLNFFDEIVRKNAPGGGTTLALSIKGLSETLCFNIGDSRIYLYYDGHFKQISIDHSLSWDLYSTGFIKKDDVKIVEAINELQSQIGNLSASASGDHSEDLNTDAKSNLVKAINEVDTHADNNKEVIGAEYTVNIEGKKNSEITNLQTDTKTSIVGAINELDARVGELDDLDTDDKDNIVDAINEVIKE